MSAVLAMYGEFWGPLGAPQLWMHTLRSVHDHCHLLGANENSCDRAVGCPCSCMLQQLALSCRQVLGASGRSPAVLRVCIIVIVRLERTETVVKGLLAAHAIACCGRLALSCRLMPKLSFRWLGLAASPVSYSNWWWLCRGSATQQSQHTPQQEVSGDRLQVP